MKVKRQKAKGKSSAAVYTSCNVLCAEGAFAFTFYLLPFALRRRRFRPSPQALLPFTFCLLPFAFYLAPQALLPFTFCLLPFAFYLVPQALLPFTFCLLPFAKQ